MKNFLRFLTVVMSAIFAFACTTDTTEDLGVNLAVDQTIINISLEESRTHIGDKDGDEYPLYWSEGDRIAVNGIASEAIGAAAHGKKSAQFTINAALEHPLDIVYPAPAEGVVAPEGMRAVTFQPIQNYTKGSFANGAAPMYAHVEANGDAIALNHLAGVLSIAPMGEGVTLSAIAVEAESGKLAGNFDLDCTTGALTAHADAVNSVTVSFGEGLALGAEPTPIYIAVPAGNYGMITVTLYTATDNMAVSFDTSAGKAIKAGIVRQFPAFDYAGNSTDTDTFLIYDEASLRRFAEKAADFAPYTKAKVVASIDMTGKQWSPVFGFGEYEFDGGNKDIKGLTAPLFDTTATSIKNVRLVDIDMTVTGSDAGALAGTIYSENAVVENCYVSGKFTIDAATPAYIHGEALHYASIIGYSASTKTFSNLTADVEIVAKGDFGAALTRIGGAISFHCGKLSNTTNLGSITFEGKIDGTPMLSGVAHCCTGGMANCTNRGAITANGTLNNNLMASGISCYGRGTLSECNNYGDILIDTKMKGELYISGFLSRTNSTAITAEKCNNYGNITIKGEAALTRIGGLVEEDWNEDFTLTDCHNHGNITIDNNTSINASIVIAGLLAYRNDANNITFTNCSNNGEIAIKSGASINGNVQLGGFCAYCVANSSSHKTTFTSCTNSGNITIEDGASVTAIYCGGLVGNKTNASKLYIDGCTNKGAIDYNGTSTGVVMVAGILGIHSGSAATLGVMNTVTNEGTLTIGGSAKGNVRIGGIVGAYAQTWSSESKGATIWNKGDINVSLVNNATPSATSFLVGGIMGAMGQPNLGAVTWYSECDLNVTSSNVYVGGVVGSQTGSGAKDVKNAYYFGNIKATNVTTAGMLTGAARSKLFKTCGIGGSIQRSGMSEAVTLNIENFHSYAYSSDEQRDIIINTDGIGYISAIDETPSYALPTKIGTVDELLALAANPTGDITLTADLDLTDVEWTPIDNYAGTFDGDNHKIIGLKAPLFGTTTATVNLKNIHLTDVNILHTSEELFYLGALACHIDSATSIIRNCSAEGNIEININNAATNTYYVGGIIGRTTTSKTTSGLVSRINFTTTGDIFALYLGGCVGSAPNSILDNCQNYGTKTLNSRFGGSQLIGGVVSTCKGVTNCTNGSEKVGEKQLLGKIIYNGEHYGTATRYIDIAGVCAFTNANATVAADCKNYGTIEAGGSVISGSQTMLRVGGVFTNVERIANGAVANCDNYGDIIVSQSHPGTKNAMVSGVCNVMSVGLNLAELSNLHNYGNITVTKDASFSKNLLLGGIMNVFDNPRTYKNLYNHGNITIEEGVAIGGELQLGGITGRVKTEALGAFEGTFANEGAISIGANVASHACIGGVFGYYGKPDVSANVINIGDISVTGTLSGTVYVGGVCGGSATAGSITNAKCHCNIYSPDYTPGFIFGKERSETTIANNCAVGGMLVKEWDDSDAEPVAKGTKLNASNYFKYLYTSEPEWENANYDGCTLLTSKPSLQ